VDAIVVNTSRPMLGLHVRVGVVRVPVRLFGIITDVETHAGAVDALVAQDEHQAEDRLGEDIQNPVEDGFGVGVQDVGTFAESPGDGVKEPDEEGQDATAEEHLVDIAAESLGVLAGRHGERVNDIQEGGAAEGEVTPLVPRSHQGADQAGDDHDLVQKDGVQNGRPRHASRQEQIEKQQRCRDEPFLSPLATDYRKVDGLGTHQSMYRT